MYKETEILYKDGRDPLISYGEDWQQSCKYIHMSQKLLRVAFNVVCIRFPSLCNRSLPTIAEKKYKKRDKTRIPLPKRGTKVLQIRFSRISNDRKPPVSAVLTKDLRY